MNDSQSIKYFLLLSFHLNFHTVLPLPIDVTCSRHFTRMKPQPRHSISVTPEATRRWSSFLHLHIPEHHWRDSLTHLHLPSFTVTSADGESNRRFHFGLRRHSHHVSHGLLDACAPRQRLTQYN